MTHARQVLGMVAVVVATVAAASARGETETRAAAYDESKTANDIEEITVTARKRDETSIAVPVVVTAIGAKELQARAIDSVDSLARLVPQLLVGESGGSAQGGSVTLRGISGGDGNALADQAVAFNIDDVAITFTSPRRLGEMDVAAVEVLKGPQTLLYGKDSPAGVITIRSNDPTPDFATQVSAGYDFGGREWRGEGYISGPLTDTLGARLAFFGSNIGGWLNNSAAPLAASYPYINSDSHGPVSREGALRGTLKFDLGANFHARLKVSYDHLRDSGINADTQLIRCPYGTPQLASPLDDCKADQYITRGDLGPILGTVDPNFGNGSTFDHSYELLSSLNVDYDFSDGVKLTSVTGIYNVSNRIRDTFNDDYRPIDLVASAMGFASRDVSQELRVASDFQSPLNFTSGAYFQHTHTTTDADTYTFFTAATPTQLNNYYYLQTGKTYSAFGQLLWRIVPTLELSGGGRYSDEKKQLPLIELSSPAAPLVRAPVAVNPAFTHGSWNNFSPEGTISWRPSRSLTVYGSYKKGFLSGGFNAGSTVAAVTSNQGYAQELIHGFEGGVKSAMLDNTLRTNFDAYYYKLDGLQVVSFPGVGQAGTTTNAGAVSIRGAEFDATYRTPVTGLSVNGALDYNDGRYDVYQAACYPGETQALGCDYGNPKFVANPAAPGTLMPVYSAQNLSGTRLTRAPVWTGNFGAQYEHPISAGFKASLSGNVTYSSWYATDPLETPGGYMPAFALLDAGLRVSRADDKWQVALIGRNLTNKYYYVRSSFQSFTGTSAGTVTSRLPDLSATTERGRELWLRLTAKWGE